MQLPWLYHLQLLLHIEVAQHWQQKSHSKYLCALLGLSFDLAHLCRLLDAPELRRLVCQAKETVEALEEIPGKVLDKAQHVLVELQERLAEAEEDEVCDSDLPVLLLPSLHAPPESVPSHALPKTIFSTPSRQPALDSLFVVML